MTTEKRLIDAKRLRESVVTDYYEHYTQCHTTDQIALMDMVEYCIEEQPTVDAVEVVHGRWIKQWCDNNMIGHEYAECSICGCSMLDTNQFWNSKHCPNCGAKMDGDKHD